MRAWFSTALSASALSLVSCSAGTSLVGALAERAGHGAAIAGAATLPTASEQAARLCDRVLADEQRALAALALELEAGPTNAPLAAPPAHEDGPDWGELDDDAGAKAALDDDADPGALLRVTRERDAQADELPRLAAIARETWIYSQPDRKKARRLGYLRAGAVVERKPQAVSTKGCKGGWYEIAPEGFVCLGRSASLDPFHPVVDAAKRRARRDGLPYEYVMSRTPGPPFYTRLPSESEQARAEPDLGYFHKKLKAIEKDPAFVPLPEAEAMPSALLYGQALPALADAPPRSETQLVAGNAGVRSGFALLSQFDHDGRRFGVTTDLHTIPLDRTRWVKPSAFRGLELSSELTLPVAFVMKKRATRHSREEGGRFRATDALDHRAVVPLTGQKQGSYLEAKDGSWVKQEDVRTIEPMSRPPTWAKDGKKWIDVSILQQSLVAYEGLSPRYVTLVSTGADGLGDPKKTHSTVQGVFLIHTKHVSVTMDGDETGDEFDLRDVPFVQYFNEGYALHAAYWHDDFGTPRSHGCVNLAPHDAAWLFGWTTPEVPEAWHAALSIKRGTLVYTHP